MLSLIRFFLLPYLGLGSELIYRSLPKVGEILLPPVRVGLEQQHEQVHPVLPVQPDPPRQILHDLF